MSNPQQPSSMAKRRVAGSCPQTKPAQPDRSAPTGKTLLDLAHEREQLEQAKRKELAADAMLSPTAERILETLLWTVSLVMLHGTLDVLVQSQFAQAIEWRPLLQRAGLAFMVLGTLFFTLHPHDSNPTPVPGLPARWQCMIRQTVFFLMSLVAGCYLIHITNTYGYYNVMKQAPSLGCLWIWSVIELELLPACLSLLAVGGFLWKGEYSIR